MKLSYNWIKEYIDTDLPAEELAEKLTMSGSEVGSIEITQDDTVMDLEITSNRPDCLNIIGLARETALLTDTDLKMPDIEKFYDNSEETGIKIECRVKDAILCPRYTARVITGVEIKEASDTVLSRIRAMGCRPVNNVVDMTNFCLFETGQPMHAFDMDKIEGRKIIVRRSVKGEKIVTIDGVERELQDGMLIIADEVKPIAVAGIMGGENTAVSQTTKNIVLESAYFDPASVRETSRKLGLSSDSSYRFERGVDKGTIKWASDRAVGLIIKETSGKCGQWIDLGSADIREKKINVSVEKIEKLLGVDLDIEEIKVILKKLGMTITEKGERVLDVIVPSFREDINRAVDISEEIARIKGFDSIPETVPTPAPWSPRKTSQREVIERMKNSLCSAGFSEIMTYSLTSGEAARLFPDIQGESVKLMNPVSAEHEILTPHLMDGLLKAIVWNINRGCKDLKFFETGKAYSKKGSDPFFEETPTLSLGVTGDLYRNWREGATPSDFYFLKGVLQNMAETFRIDADITPANACRGFVNAAWFTVDGLNAGIVGEIDPQYLALYGIEQKVFAAQISLPPIFEGAVLGKKYMPIPRYPFSTRDLSVLCLKQLRVSEIEKVLVGQNTEILRDVHITDMYEGKQIPEGKKSITFRLTYGLPERTLTDAEIEEAHSKIKEHLTRTLDISFR